jgi:sortase A
MIVRLLVADKHPASRLRALRWLEYAFLFFGLIALDYVVWIQLDSAFSQSYENWSFDRQLHRQGAGFGAFVADEIGLGRHSSGEHAAPDNQPTQLVPAAGSRRSRTEKAPLKLQAVPSVIGRISIPRLRLSAMVREGTEEGTLRRAVGHIPSTALPGQAGNVALAAHRDTFFRGLRGIRKQDKVTVETLDGSYDYVVDSLKIVKPSDVSVLKPVADQQSLTLVTCYPFNYIGSAPKRFIVHATRLEVSPPPPPPPLPGS